MMENRFDRPGVDNSWCPGCGNFGILKMIKEILDEMGVTKQETVIVSGIGQAAKTPYYIDVNMYGVLHGRALPVATAVKLANPGLNVVAEGGDGDMYGEGGNHFLHTIRRNPDIVHIVHNNMVYGLTKGQASPTSQKGFVSKVQVSGVQNEPFNPLAVALASKAGFVSRVNIGNYKHAKEVLRAAFVHKGYALVDIFQPCVVFNKVNTFQWFRENTYELEKEYDPTDFGAALEKVHESMPMPIGILYRHDDPKETFESHIRGEDLESLHAKKHDVSKIQEMFERY